MALANNIILQDILLLIFQYCLTVNWVHKYVRAVQCSLSLRV